MQDFVEPVFARPGLRQQRRHPAQFADRCIERPEIRQSDRELAEAHRACAHLGDCQDQHDRASTGEDELTERSEAGIDDPDPDLAAPTGVTGEGEVHQAALLIAVCLDERDVSQQVGCAGGHLALGLAGGSLGAAHRPAPGHDDDIQQRTHHNRRQRDLSIHAPQHDQGSENEEGFGDRGLPPRHDAVLISVDIDGEARDQITAAVAIVEPW